MIHITNIDWSNTPGALYAIAYWLTCWIVICNGPARGSRVRRILTTTGLGAALITLMTVTHGAKQWLFAPLMALYILIIWLMIYLACDYCLLTSIYYAARAFIMGEFIASAEWLIYYYLVEWNVAPINWLSMLLTVLLVDGLLTGILFWLERRNKKVNESVQVNVQELLSAVTIALAIFVISNLSYVFDGAKISPLILSQLFLVRTLVDLGGIAILYAYHVQLGELNARYEVERLQDMLAMQTQNYEMLEQSVQAVNQKYHDLKYQIAVLREEFGTPKSMAYLDQMEQEIKAYEAQNKTGNKILDTILTGKSLYCQSNWIELTSVADGKELDFMDPMDISTLFGNMLDNAIESVSKIQQKERRLIHLAIARQKGFVRIRMENCYDIQPQFENGVPKTTKKDKKYHGFGVKSIQNTVRKYGGSTTMKAENGWFELRILIPLK